MLSIASVGRGTAGYYAGLAEVSYYGMSAASWRGAGAKELGLSEIFRAPDLVALFGGALPNGKPLVQNAGSKSRQAGWDLTFSAPKSVSVLWGISGEEVRKKIEEAHELAVTRALQYLESQHAYSRRGKGGVIQEACGLVIASFRHGASRVLDPQLHSHAVVLNIGVRQDGTTGTILSKPFYKAKMAAGAVYRAELAAELTRALGVALIKTRHAFEISGIPERVLQHFSKRRKEILKDLGARGLSGSKASEVSALGTRKSKNEPDPILLRDGWTAVTNSLGFRPDQVLGNGRPHRGDPESLLKAAIQEASLQKSVFTETDLIRSLATHAVTHGFSGREAVAMSQKAIVDSPHLVRLGATDGVPLLTTRENLEAELWIVRAVKDCRVKTGHHVGDRNLESVLSRHGLNEEQRNALEVITNRSGQIAAVSGLAGTGKTTLLKAAREAWERRGFKVHGAAVSGKAAQGLFEGAGIPSDTLVRFLGLATGPTSLGPLLTSRSVVVIDEGSMVPTKLMEQLIITVVTAGAKLVLVGDERQLQPVEAGCPFAKIANLLNAPRLSIIERQSEPWARKLVRDASQGNSDHVLKALADNGALFVDANRRDAMKHLIQDWATEFLRTPKDALILTGTKREVATLNELAQYERVKQGLLKGASIDVSGGQALAGDRILITKNDRKLGVKNGNLGTLISISPLRRSAEIRLDSGKSVNIPRESFSFLRLGYAMTTHAAQGATFNAAFVLMGGRMLSRELAYVQLSRARARTSAYTDRANAGDRLESLAKAMSRSERQPLAIEVDLDTQRRHR